MRRTLLSLTAIVALSSAAVAQAPPDPKVLIAAQREGMAPLSYAQGYQGDFVITPTADGYTWEIPAGPMTIRYTAVVNDGKWREVGDRIMPGRAPVRFFEMNLVRVGDSDWPGAGAISPK